MTGDSAGENSFSNVQDAVNNPVILDACLTYIKYNMMTRDKAYIQEVVCSRFDLEAIVKARGLIFKYCEPNKSSVYRGPNSSKTLREKAIHAFQGIFSKLSELDVASKSPIIACSSDDLNSLLSSNGPCDHMHVDHRLEKLESDISELKRIESSVNDLKQTVIALITSPSLSAEVTDKPQCAVPYLTDYPPFQRNRSSSVRSVKRTRSESEQQSAHDMDTGREESVQQGEFIFPRTHLKQQDKRDKRQKVLSEGNSYANVTDKGTPKHTSYRERSNWGKFSVNTSNGFSAAVPDGFIFGCSMQTDADTIKSHLMNRGLKVKNVELVSHERAVRRSFRVIVDTISDFENLVSGEHIPKFIRVRRYIPPRKTPGNQSWDSKKPPFVNDPNKQLYQSQLNELNLLGKDMLTSPVISQAPNSTAEGSV